MVVIILLSYSHDLMNYMLGHCVLLHKLNINLASVLLVITHHACKYIIILHTGDQSHTVRIVVKTNIIEQVLMHALIE